VSFDEFLRDVREEVETLDLSDEDFLCIYLSGCENMRRPLGLIPMMGKWSWIEEDLFSLGLRVNYFINFFMLGF